MSAMLSLREVTKIYPGAEHIRAVDNLSFDLQEGEICTVVGPSGCGKTTAMKMINRLIPMTTGKILVDGQNIDRMDTIELRRSIGYVIQNIGLFPNMTIAENIAIVPKLKKWDAGKISEKVESLLEMVNLPPEEFMDRYPKELSGGQQQRIGVARGMAADPPIMLMDEPFGPSILSTGSICRTNFCAFRKRSERPSSLSPTTSTRPSRWATRSASCATESSCSSTARKRS